MQTLPNPHLSETLCNTLLYASAIFAVGLALAVLALGEDVHGLFGAAPPDTSAPLYSNASGEAATGQAVYRDNDVNYYLHVK